MAADLLIFLNPCLLQHVKCLSSYPICTVEVICSGLLELLIEHGETEGLCASKQDATSGVWHKRQLYIATPSAVYVVLVALSSTPHLEVSRALLS